MNRYREIKKSNQRFYCRFSESMKDVSGSQAPPAEAAVQPAAITEAAPQPAAIADAVQSSETEPAAENCAPQYTHTHEFNSSTGISGLGADSHNHRFAGVTSEVIPGDGGRHKHAIFTLTDSFGHIHEVAVETGPDMDLGYGKHVHFVTGATTVSSGHSHTFDFATLVEAPLTEKQNGQTDGNT